MPKYLSKLFIGMTSAALTCCVLTACGSDDSSDEKDSKSDISSSISDTDSEERGEPETMAFSTDVFSVEAPLAYGLVAVPDMLDKYEGDTDPNAVYIILNGKSDTDIIQHPYIWLTYYPDASKYASSKAFYDDVKDLDPTEIGGKTWEGYSYVSSGYPGFCLTAKEGDGLWVCLVSSERSNGEKISADDADFKSILMSIKLR